MASWVEKAKQAVGLSQPEEEAPSSGLLQHLDEASTLSRTQRLLWDVVFPCVYRDLSARVYGFGTCFGIALVFGFLSSLFFLSPTKFAVLYTISNLSALGSTMFLMGPMKQLAKMCDKGRVVATCLYFTSMVLTLVAALKFQSVILTLIFLIVQLAALLWYCLSYIPFAREMVSRMASSILGE